MKAYASKILPATAVFGIVIGVNLAYNRYRGTGLSRVPEIGASRLEAAARTDRDDPHSELGDAAPVPAEIRTRPATVRRNADRTAAFVKDDLLLYPSLTKGMRTPLDLWRYYGRGVSSFSSPILRCGLTNGLNSTVSKSRN